MQHHGRRDFAPALHPVSADTLSIKRAATTHIVICTNHVLIGRPICANKAATVHQHQAANANQRLQSNP